MPGRRVRSETIGKSEVRLLEHGKSFAGVIVRDGKASAPYLGDDADELWNRLLMEVGKVDPAYFGYEGAISRFFGIFPEGFRDRRFVEMERNYKVATQAFVNERIPLSRAERTTTEEARDAARAFGKTNLLSSFEQARVGEVLTGPTGPDFVRAAAALANGDHAGGLSWMERIMRDHGQPSWPAVTFLPFFWSPSRHMFLKPKVTQDFASRVGHSFSRDYSARLEAPVYRSLLSLVEETEAAVVALGPVDRIDVQSFLWVVGAYSEKDTGAGHLTA